jgi:hypothetical protein
MEHWPPWSIVLAPYSSAWRNAATVIATSAQLFEDPDQGQVFTSRFGGVRRQQFIKLWRPTPEFVQTGSEQSPL